MSPLTSQTLPRGVHEYAQGPGKKTAFSDLNSFFGLCDPSHQNPFIRFYGDFTTSDGTRPILPTNNNALELLTKKIGAEPARFLLERINLEVQMLPGTPFVINNSFGLKEELVSTLETGNRADLQIFKIAPEKLVNLYHNMGFGHPNFPKTQPESKAAKARGEQYPGWNGLNFHMDSVSVESDGKISITLYLAPNKLLDTEVKARKDGLITEDTTYGTRQFHVSEIAVVVDESGSKFLAVQAKDVWANNAGDVYEVLADDTLGKSYRVHHPALMAGGVEPEKVLIDGKSLVENPTLFAVYDQREHETGKTEHNPSPPIALLHEGIFGHPIEGKLPRSLYCNAMHVMQKADGSPITVDEIISLQKNYAKNVYPEIYAQGKDPEVRGCGFIPLENGKFEIIKAGKVKNLSNGETEIESKDYLCIRDVKTVAISKSGEVEVSTQDILLDSAYTGVLKHLLIDDDPLRQKVLEAAGVN